MRQQLLFQASMLKYVDELIRKRREIVQYYPKCLQGIMGIRCLEDREEVEHCYPNFPVFIDKDKFGKILDQVYDLLKQHNIYGRRYFYPLISQFQTYRGLPSALPENLPVAMKVADQVIC
jgi:dTDP-4-amino-4,6-dideoxygalactose transaminase